jgi:hypothetical protein
MHKIKYIYIELVGCYKDCDRMHGVYNIKFGIAGSNTTYSKKQFCVTLSSLEAALKLEQ